MSSLFHAVSTRLCDFRYGFWRIARFTYAKASLRTTAIFHLRESSGIPEQRWAGRALLMAETLRPLFTAVIYSDSVSRV